MFAGHQQYNSDLVDYGHLWFTKQYIYSNDERIQSTPTAVALLFIFVLDCYVTVKRAGMLSFVIHMFHDLGYASSGVPHHKQTKRLSF
jgi:hypothetical protein